MRTSARSFTSRRRLRPIAAIHSTTASSSDENCAWRLRAYCAFHAAASERSAYLSGAVSRLSAPMLWTGGMCAISRSTSTYLRSSASNIDSVGFDASNAAYSAAMLPFHSQLYLANVPRYSCTCRFAPSTEPVSASAIRTTSMSFASPSCTVRPLAFSSAVAHSGSAFPTLRIAREQ